MDPLQQSSFPLAQTSSYATAYEGKFSIKCLIPFHILQHWIADVKKKTSIPLDQVIKKSCDTVFNKSGNKRADPPKFTINTSKVITSLPMKLFFTPNALDLAMNLLLSNQARKHRWESAYHQFKTTNLRQHHSHL